MRPLSCGLRCLALTTLVSAAACQPSANPATGTLEVRVSDHRVAIGDFERLDITITSIGLHPVNAPRTEGWLDFEPDTALVDLTQVVGDPAVTVLRTRLLAGDYNAVRISVSDGKGTLKTGDVVNVPGFEEAAASANTVRAGEKITLVLDVIVESTEDHPGGGYVLHLLSVNMTQFPTPIVDLLSETKVAATPLPPLPTLDVAQVRKGREIYLANCASCHGPNAEGAPNWATPGPDGLGLAPPHDNTGHTWHHSDRVLYEAIREGMGDPLQPGSPLRMPGWDGKLSDTEIRAMIEYFKSLWSEDNRRWQRGETVNDFAPTPTPYP